MNKSERFELIDKNIAMLVDCERKGANISCIDYELIDLRRSYNEMLNMLISISIGNEICACVVNGASMFEDPNFYSEELKVVKWLEKQLEMPFSVIMEKYGDVDS